MLSSKSLVDELKSAGRYDDIINILKDIISDEVINHKSITTVNYHKEEYKDENEDYQARIVDTISSDDLLSEAKKLYIIITCQTSIDESDSDFPNLHLYIKTKLDSLLKEYSYAICYGSDMEEEAKEDRDFDLEYIRSIIILDDLVRDLTSELGIDDSLKRKG